MGEWTVPGCSAIPGQSVTRLKQASLSWSIVKNQFNIGVRQCLTCQILSWQEQILHMILAKRPRSDTEYKYYLPPANIFELYIADYSLMSPLLQERGKLALPNGSVMCWSMSVPQTYILQKFLLSLLQSNLPELQHDRVYLEYIIRIFIKFKYVRISACRQWEWSIIWNVCCDKQHID